MKLPHRMKAWFAWSSRKLSLILGSTFLLNNCSRIKFLPSKGCERTPASSISADRLILFRGSIAHDMTVLSTENHDNFRLFPKFTLTCSHQGIVSLWSESSRVNVCREVTNCRFHPRVKRSLCRRIRVDISGRKQEGRSEDERTRKAK